MRGGFLSFLSVLVLSKSVSGERCYDSRGPPLSNGSTLLRDWPMLFAHNAATGLMTEQNVDVLPSSSLSLFKETLIRLSQNQAGSLTAQLDCGARALDLRPIVHEGDLVMRHGDVLVLESFSKAVESVSNWVQTNVDSSEFVLLTITHCGGGATCWNMTQDALEKNAVYFVEDCSILDSLTVEQARARKVLAVHEQCINSNYDSSISCYPERSGGRRLANAEQAQAELQRLLQSSQYGANCYDKDDLPFSKLKTHLVSASSARDAKISYQNGHWQYDINSLLATNARKSSLIGDNTASDVNQFVNNLVQSGDLKYINLLQVDNVCNNGCALYSSLSTFAEKNLAAVFQGTNVTVPVTSSPTSTAARELPVFSMLLLGFFLYLV